MTAIRLLALTFLALAAIPSARAQMGTSSNVPPQHLFTTDQPQRLNNGLGTMAERRARLAQVKRAQKPVTR